MRVCLILPVVLLFCSSFAQAGEKAPAPVDVLGGFEGISLTQSDAAALKELCGTLEQALGDMRKVRREIAGDGRAFPVHLWGLEPILKMELAKVKMRLLFKHMLAVLKATPGEDVNHQYRFRVQRNKKKQWSVIEKK